MEQDLDSGDLIPPPDHRDTAVAVLSAAATVSAFSESAWRIPQQSHPLPVGFRLPFFTPFCYSPRGTSLLAKKSRRLRDLVKRADSVTLAQCAERVTALTDAGTARNFLGPDIVLVPVPRRVAYDPRYRPTAPEAIAHALRAAGHGQLVWPALRRARAVPKSVWSRPGSRPEFLAHYSSLELIRDEPPNHRFLLIDDFVTRGRTLLAAAAVLHQAMPRAQLRAFALVRTEGLTPDIAAITAPSIGAIRYVGGDAFRSP